MHDCEPFETILLLIGGLLAMNVAIVWFARRAVRTPLPPSEPRDGAVFAIEGTLAGCSRELEAPLSFTRCAAFELSQNDGTRAWRCAEQLDVRLDTGDVVSLALPEAVHAELGRRRTGRLPGGVRFETRRGRAAAAADDATEVIDGRRITTERGRLFWRGAARSWGVFAFANGVTGAVVALLRFA